MMMVPMAVPTVAPMAMGVTVASRLRLLLVPLLRRVRLAVLVVDVVVVVLLVVAVVVLPPVLLRPRLPALLHCLSSMECS